MMRNYEGSSDDGAGHGGRGAKASIRAREKGEDALLLGGVRRTRTGRTTGRGTGARLKGEGAQAHDGHRAARGARGWQRDPGGGPQKEHLGLAPCRDRRPLPRRLREGRRSASRRAATWSADSSSRTRSPSGCSSTGSPSAMRRRGSSSMGSHGTAPRRPLDAGPGRARPAKVDHALHRGPRGGARYAACPVAGSARPPATCITSESNPPRTPVVRPRCVAADRARGRPGRDDPGAVGPPDRGLERRRGPLRGDRRPAHGRWPRRYRRRRVRRSCAPSTPTA